MKMIAILLSLCLSFNVLAASGTISELEKQMDEYQFALTVEWDQKDQKFYQEQTAQFFGKINQLIQEEGLTQAQILSLAEKRMANKASLEALKAKLSLMGKVQSTEQMASILKDASAEFGSRGASWNGAITDTVLIGLVIVAVIGYAVWFDANYKCVAWSERWECDSNTSSDGLRTSTVCGWETYCSLYEKK